jgi:GntR family transcriptional repressor for pyruvate dehydrogenase complex
MAAIDEARSNFETNRNFHLAVAAAAQNAVLDEILRMLLNLRGDIHRTDLLDAAAYQETFREHSGLVDAIEQGNADEARELMRLHIEHTKDAIRKATPAL